MDSANYRLETTFLPDGSSVIHTSNSPSPSTTVWTTARPIGRGANGTTVELQSGPSGLTRAVKRVFNPASSTREVAALSKVSDRHDLFVKFLGWYQDKDFLYIAMEFVPHGDLGAYMMSRGKSPPPEETCRNIARQVLEGLRVLHERLICHRDLKPQNILVATLDPIHVKITDFGVSKCLEGTQCRTRVGTEGYIAPEVLGFWQPPRGRIIYDYAVDLWAAGCIIYELLSLQRPFARDMAGMMTDLPSGFECDQGPVETDTSLLLKYCEGQLPLPVEALERSDVSLDSMEVVRALLRAAPASRMSASEVLDYPWFLESQQPFRFRIESRATTRSTPGTGDALQEPWELWTLPEELATSNDHMFTAEALPSLAGRRSSRRMLPRLDYRSRWDILGVPESLALRSSRKSKGKRNCKPPNHLVVTTNQPKEDIDPKMSLERRVISRGGRMYLDAGVPTATGFLGPHQLDCVVPPANTLLSLKHRKSKSAQSRKRAAQTLVLAKESSELALDDQNSSLVADERAAMAPSPEFNNFTDFCMDVVPVTLTYPYSPFHGT